MQASYAEKVIFLRETLSSGRNSRIQKLLCAGVSLHLTLHVVPKTGQGEFERRNFTMVSEQKIDLSVGSRKHLLDCVNSYQGLNGGDPRNPIWFCALEWGGGIVNEGRTIVPEDFKAYEQDNYFLTAAEVDDYIIGKFAGSNRGRRGGCSFYRSQFGILTALIENTPSQKEMTAARPAARKYHFFGESRFGYSLNVSPISMSSRSKADKEWRKVRRLKSPESEQFLTLAEWTGFSSYSSFFSWCAKQRKPRFTALRKKYAPTVIYCGGLVALQDFKNLWMDEGTENENFNHEIVLNQDYYFRWLDNGEGENDTLLMVGPFFCNRYGLNGYKKYWRVADLIRKICNDKFGSEEKWLRISEFL